MFPKAARYAPLLKSNYQSVRVPVVGPSTKGVVQKLGPERSINWYPVKPEREGEPWVLRGRPGLALHCTLNYFPIRGAYVHNGRYFAVGGSWVHEVDEAENFTEVAEIGTSRGKVTLAGLLDTLIIGDGAGFYSLDLDTAIVVPVTDAPVGRFCVRFDQRMLYQGQNGQVFYSELNDPTNIPGLNFFTAESLPDEIVAIVPTEDQIWLFGADSTEVWYDSGDADNPFQRIPGSTVYSGCGFPDTALRLDNSVWWVEKDKDGKGIVRRSNGFTPMRVSTSAVERFTSVASSLSAFSYQEEGHTFYGLNAPEGSWVFDLKAQEWHERAWLNRNTGEQERQRPETHAFAYGLHLVTDYATGNVYKQGNVYKADVDQEIRRTRITPALNFAGRQIILSELWLDFATGVGLPTGFVPPVEDPEIE